MAKKPEKWMQKAFAKNKGALHRDLGVPADQPIPPGKLEAATKKPGKTGLRARAAFTAAKLRAKAKTSKKY